MKKNIIFPVDDTKDNLELMVRLLFEQNSILSRKVIQKKNELEITQNTIINHLGLVSMFRDKETGEHIKRMSKMCYYLGRSIGFDKQEADLIEKAAKMHDIGKIGIPDSILQKPGRLTPQEYRIMMTHTEIGANLLFGSNLPLLKTAGIIAMTHHEKWNGTGYNKGLKGEEIPLYGRIACVCDALDALLSKRPYKDAWSLDNALQEIIKSSGSHFDPFLVKHLIKIRPKIETIIKNNNKCDERKISKYDNPVYPFTRAIHFGCLQMITAHA